MKPFAEALVKNPGLLRIQQDPECRPPYPVYRGRVLNTDVDPETGTAWREYPDAGLTLFKHLNGGEFAVGYFNFAPASGELPFIFADAGLPYGSGLGLHLTDAMTGRIWVCIRITIMSCCLLTAAGCCWPGWFGRESARAGKRRRGRIAGLVRAGTVPVLRPGAGDG